MGLAQKCHSPQSPAVLWLHQSILATDTRVARPHFSDGRYHYKRWRCFSLSISPAVNKCGVNIMEFIKNFFHQNFPHAHSSKFSPIKILRHTVYTLYVYVYV